MKKINISTLKHPNIFTMVDNGDYKELSRHKWHAGRYKEGGLYAKRSIRVSGKVKVLKMHIVIMGRLVGMEIDHINSDTLDNQRRNLRQCTHRENLRNRNINCNNASGYKGVSWHREGNKWQACIKRGGKTLYLGLFFCLIKAAKAYDRASREYYREFAALNFPEDGEQSCRKRNLNWAEELKK